MRIIRGKKALITGAASGIGRAIALALAQEGADVFLVDINEDGLADVAREIGRHGTKVVTATCDLSDPAQIEALTANLRRRWNGLNILVNNAGITYYGHTHLMTGAQWNRIMAVNLLAPIQLTHKLLPLLLTAGEAHILNVSSMFGLATWRKTAAYQTSKFGLVGFSAALRAEYCSDSFGVTALCPGFVRSSLLKAGETDKADRQLARSGLDLRERRANRRQGDPRHSPQSGRRRGHAGRTLLLAAGAVVSRPGRLADPRRLAPPWPACDFAGSRNRSCRRRGGGP